MFELSWDDCPTCYADSPSTKAEYCLRTVFKLPPIAALEHLLASLARAIM